MIPSYELTGESFNISGRGTVFTARLTCDCKREDLGQFLGQSINNQIIIGIESFAIPDQRKGMGIGFLVQKEKIKMGEDKFTVSWMMVDEKMIKFKEVDEAYDLADPVVAFIEKNKLHEKEGIQVQVKIDTSKGDNGTITDLQEIGATSTSVEEPPVTEEKETTGEPSEDLIVKELTVAGVAVQNKALTFKEEDKVWYTLDDAIDPQEFKDKYTKKVVEVSIRKTDQGNDVIVAFTAKEEQKEDTSKDSEKPSTEKKSYSNAMQVSIEAQASMNSACRVAQAILTKDSLPEHDEKIIKRIGEYNFQLIQDLKNK